MKPNDPFEEDQRLSQVLGEWKVNAPLPPRFREQVWRRIEKSTAAAPDFWTVWRSWFDAVLPRPALAFSYVAILLFIGAGAGWTEARNESKRVDTALGMQYVRSIDPYQSAATAEHP